MFYATILHALAGLVAGSVFKIRTLTILLFVVPIEAMTLIVAGFSETLLWAVVNLIIIQLGYFAGIFARRAVEQLGYSVPPTKIRWRQ